MSISVLVLDDSEVAGEMLKMLFDLKDHDTAVATRVDAAKGMMLRARFDVVVLDYYLDGMHNGMEVLRWMRERKITSPVLISSAAEQDVLDEIAKACVDENLAPVKIVNKPRDPELLLADVYRLAQLNVPNQVHEIRLTD